MNFQRRWNPVCLGDLCDSVSVTYRGADKDVVLINTSDVYEGKVLNHNKTPNKNLKGQFKKTFQKGDILYSEIRPANKRYAFVDFEDTKHYIASTKLMVLRPHTDAVLPRFLLSVLGSAEVLAKLQLLAETRSGTFPQITFDAEIAPFQIMLPDKSIQEKIVSVSDALADKINLNTHINDNLQQMTRAVFRAWFIDYSPFGYGIPNNWKRITFKTLARISTDVFSPSKNPESSVEHYSIPAYDERRYPVFETASNIKSNKYRLTKHSVMISKLNPTIKRLWRPYCLSDNPICSTEFIVYEPLNPLHRDYIYSIIDNTRFSAFLCAHTTGSTNSRQRATPSVTLEYETVLPEEPVIQKFCSIVTPLYDMMERNILENECLAALRDALLPRLMSGELDVSELDL